MNTLRVRQTQTHEASDSTAVRSALSGRKRSLLRSELIEHLLPLTDGDKTGAKARSITLGSNREVVSTCLKTMVETVIHGTYSFLFGPHVTPSRNILLTIGTRLEQATVQVADAEKGRRRKEKKNG